MSEDEYNMHSHLMTTAKLRRIGSYVDEILAKLNADMCCDYMISDSVRMINTEIQNLYDYVTNIPPESEDSEGESEDEGEDMEEMELNIDTEELTVKVE